MSKSSGRRKVSDRESGSTDTDAEIKSLLTSNTDEQENVVLGNKAGSDTDGIDFDFDNVFNILKIIAANDARDGIIKDGLLADVNTLLQPYIILTSTLAYQDSQESLVSMKNKDFALPHHADVVVSMLEIAQRLVPSVSTDVVPVYKSVVSQEDIKIEYEFRSQYAGALVGFSSYTTLQNPTMTNRISVARLFIASAISYARWITTKPYGIDYTLSNIHKLIVNSQYRESHEES